MTEHRDNDVDEIVRVARGDRAALAMLYGRYSGIMLALGIRMLGTRREAEDILHDVFVEVWQRSGDYDPRRGTVRTWLFIRMRSRCLDRLKSADRTRSQPVSDGSDAPVASRDVVSELDGARLRSAMNELPDDQRVVLLLGYFEGLSSSEISARLAIPIGTVKSRTAAAMSTLRNRFREHGDSS